MEEIDEYRQDLLTALEAVFNDLSKATASVPTKAWHKPVGPDIQTPHYILARLLALETHLYAIQLPRILQQGTSELPIFNPSDWLERHYEPEKPAQVMLDELLQQHQQELTWLRELPPEDWSRLIRHPWWGERTFLWWVERQLDEDRQHVRQLVAALTM